MTNIFFLDFYSRLKVWADFRDKISTEPLEVQVVEVDKFWQQAPIITHYLHPCDVEDWPDPWELINDNNYCYYGRALGMVYTLLLLGVKDIDFVDAIDDNEQNVVLVLVDNAKYTLNYWPNSVLNINLSGFKILKKIDVDILRKKIGDD